MMFTRLGGWTAVISAFRNPLITLNGPRTWLSVTPLPQHINIHPHMQECKHTHAHTHSHSFIIYFLNLFGFINIIKSCFSGFPADNFPQSKEKSLGFHFFPFPPFSPNTHFFVLCVKWRAEPALAERDGGGQSDSSWAVLRESDSGCSQTLCGLGVWSPADGQGGGRESPVSACVCACVCVCAHVFTLSRVRSRLSVAAAWLERSAFRHSAAPVWKINTHCHHSDMAHLRIIFIHVYLWDLRDLQVRGSQASVWFLKL